MCAKNYQNIAWFDKVIAKIKWCSFGLTWYILAKFGEGEFYDEGDRGVPVDAGLNVRTTPRCLWAHWL